LEIAKRSRATPRVAGRLLQRVCDFATVQGAKEIDAKLADGALQKLDVDAKGLDAMDRRYLRLIAENYNGGPVGVETISAALSEQRDVIEEVVEPYLIQQSFIQRTPRGRMVTDNAYTHLGMKAPVRAAEQISLLSSDDHDD
jgi:Holliday junction DNA helicase RuvB